MRKNDDGTHPARNKKNLRVMDSAITASRKFLTSSEGIQGDRLQSTSKICTKARAARATRLFIHSINHFIAPDLVSQIML